MQAFRKVCSSTFVILYLEKLKKTGFFPLHDPLLTKGANRFIGMENGLDLVDRLFR